MLRCCKGLFNSGLLSRRFYGLMLGHGSINASSFAHHLYFKCKFVSVSIKEWTVLPVWWFICISTGAFFVNVQLWVLHELIPLMCCHLSPGWRKTSGWIIYISALWKPALILGATTHNQEFSSQIRGRQRPLRHLLHAIRRRRMPSDFSFVWKN